MKKGIWLSLLAMLLIASVIALPTIRTGLTQKPETEASEIDKAKRKIVDKKDDNTKKKPEVTVIKRDQTVTFLVELEEKALIDIMLTSDGEYQSVRSLLLSESGNSFCDKVRKSQAVVKTSIRKLVTDSDFSDSRSFSAVINAMTVKAPFQDKEKIEKINGVKSVYVFYGDYETFDNDDPDGTEKSADPENTEPENSDPEDFDPHGTDPENSDTGDTDPEEADEDAATTGKLTEIYRDETGLEQAYVSGYYGEGMLISVIDSEFNTEHEAFSVSPEITALDAGGLERLYERVGFNTLSKYKAADVFHGDKICFAYDYAENDCDTSDEKLDHGTAVAAAAAGNNGKEGVRLFTGTARDAQLALMKVASERNSDGTIKIDKESVLAAIDDSVKLGADVINLSFGSYELPDNADLMEVIFNKLEKTGTLVVSASGNGSVNGSALDDYTDTDTRDIHYSTCSNIASANGVLSAGAVSSGIYVSSFMTAGDTVIAYDEISDQPLYDVYEDHTAEYVFLNTVGTNEAYKTITSEGKLVFTLAGELSIEELAKAAYLNGASALALIDDGVRPVPVSDLKVPVITISKDYLSYLMNNTSGELTLYSYSRIFRRDEEKTPEVYNSYCVSPSLELKPRLLTPGDSICSASSDGGYDYYTGSSISAPFVTGMYLLVRQYLGNNEYFAEDDPYTLKNNACALLLSNSDALSYSSSEGCYGSPRIQGGGSADMQKALTSGTMLTSLSGAPASFSIGDGKRSEYELSFTVVNYSQEEKQLTLSSVIQTDSCRSDGNGRFINTFEPRLLEGFETEFYVSEEMTDSVTVAAMDKAEVRVVVRVPEDEAEAYLERFPEGYYIDGYIFLSGGEGETAMNLPFTGFYGSWDGTDPFDADIYDNKRSVSGLENTLAAVAIKDNGYSEVPLKKGENGIHLSREAVRCYTDDSGYGYSFALPDIYTLCDVYEYSAELYGSDGKSLFVMNFDCVGCYRSAGLRPFEKLSKVFADGEKNFANLAEGKYKYIISAKTKAYGGGLSDSFTRSYQLVIDNTAPAEVKNRIYNEDGRTYLALSAKDSSGILDFRLYAAAYSSTDKNYKYTDSLDDLIKAGYISEDCYQLVSKETAENGSAEFIYDITKLSEELSKLKTRTNTWINKSSAYKIVFMAVDYAENTSKPMVADTICYGTAKFTFTDQNGVPAQGITVKLDNKKLTTDNTGTVTFKNIMPDYYRAEVIYDENSFDIDTTSYFVSIRSDRPDFEAQQNVVFKGDYPEEESSSQSSGSSDDKSSSDSPVSSDPPLNDNSWYAVIFVGILLIICVVSLLLRNKQINSK